MLTLSMFESQAIYSDSDNESNYEEFENLNYENDILFDQNVDPSIETFSVNIQRNAIIYDDSEEFISKELQKKIQNEDDDSDCVVSSDMESLNSDSEASNEDFNFPNHSSKTNYANPKLALGQIFQNKKEFKEVITIHEIKIGRTVEWIKDDSVRAKGALEFMFPANSVNSMMDAVTSFRSHSFRRLSMSAIFTRRILKRLKTIVAMKSAVLFGEIAGLDLRGAAATLKEVHEVELSEAVQRMEELIPQVILLLEATVKRCINFTGGSEVDELIPICTFSSINVNSYISCYISDMFSIPKNHLKNLIASDSGNQLDLLLLTLSAKCDRSV
ncbi:hypothetical protein BC332_15589 [Capsicum chinense]|nr:hypothetical protein BC332_15589 [Capsicum chinense]